MRKILNFNAQARRGKARICVSILSQSFSLSLSLILMFVQVLLLFLCYYYEAVSLLSLRIANHSGNGQLLSRRYCKHSGWLFSCATSYGVIVPRRFGGFVQVLQTV